MEPATADPSLLTDTATSDTVGTVGSGGTVGTQVDIGAEGVLSSFVFDQF